MAGDPWKDLKSQDPKEDPILRALSITLSRRILKRTLPLRILRKTLSLRTLKTTSSVKIQIRTLSSMTQNP